MEQLEGKLQAELQASARVVACRFPFPTWTPDHVTGEGIDTVWVYDGKSFKSHKTTEELLNDTEVNKEREWAAVRYKPGWMHLYLLFIYNESMLFVGSVRFLTNYHTIEHQ